MSIAPTNAEPPSTVPQAPAHVHQFVAEDKSDLPSRSKIFIPRTFRKPLPFPNSLAESTIYASHVLEHCCFEDGKRLVRKNIRRCSVQKHFARN